LSVASKIPRPAPLASKMPRTERLVSMRFQLTTGGRMKKGPRGFSLIELLIVVAIILIIAAIAIPNLLRSRIAANQASAVGSLRTLNTAEVTYSTTYNTGYSATLGDLGPPAASSPTPTASFAGLIDEVLSGITTPGTTVTTN